MSLLPEEESLISLREYAESGKTVPVVKKGVLPGYLGSVMSLVDL